MLMPTESRVQIFLKGIVWKVISLKVPHLLRFVSHEQIEYETPQIVMLFTTHQDVPHCSCRMVHIRNLIE